jgi:fatty acid desaturase
MIEQQGVEEGIVKPEHTRELAIQRLKMKQDFKGIAAGGVLAVAICFLVWQFGDDSFPWPVWVAFGVAVALVVQGWKTYGPSNHITEADVQREMERG